MILKSLQRHLMAELSTPLPPFNDSRPAICRKKRIFKCFNSIDNLGWNVLKNDSIFSGMKKLFLQQIKNLMSRTNFVTYQPTFQLSNDWFALILWRPIIYFCVLTLVLICFLSTSFDISFSFLKSQHCIAVQYLLSSADSNNWSVN